MARAAGAGCGDGGPGRVPDGQRGGGESCACDRCLGGEQSLPAWTERSPQRSSCHSPAAPGPRRHLWRQLGCGKRRETEEESRKEVRGRA